MALVYQPVDKEKSGYAAQRREKQDAKSITAGRFTLCVASINVAIANREEEGCSQHGKQDRQRRDAAAAPASLVCPIGQAAPLAGVLTPID
ncbi:hypothetical protein [Sphingobium xenophagum]|uniref:hypothetical protein n=1 Tax=Sphingobium xenophagum TaxID=121428 RepID=UPI0010320116|nr:hypothetical protein [Sphingobium xenophagum]